MVSQKNMFKGFYQPLNIGRKMRETSYFVG